MKVKICGITNLEDALAACDAGADALGFNFAEEAKPKHRYVAPEKARAIISKLPPFLTSVAVCVNEPTERLKEYLEFVDYVQLHGEETAEQCNDIGARAIKVFRVSKDFDPGVLADYRPGAFLFDAYSPDRRGGTGKVADWDAVNRFAAKAQPLILAGGLTPENVAQAVESVRPYAVDTAGGVESEPGRKDHDRIRRFIDNAKASVS